MRGSAVLHADTGLPFAQADGFLGAIDCSLAYGSSPQAMQAWTIDQNGRRFDSLFAVAGSGKRQDGARFLCDTPKLKRQDSASDGFHLARQLEYIHAEVMEQPLPELSAFRLFPISSEVPPGVRFHTVRRVNQAGEAVVYRDGQAIPRVGVAQVEEQFPVRHYVSSYGYNVFDQQSSEYARTNLLMRLTRTCRDVIMRLANQLSWFGSNTHGIYGVLNYPWLAKKVAATPFTMDASADDLLAELHAIANFPAEQSKGVFSPNVMAVSIRFNHVISTRRMGATPDGTVLTVKEFFLKTTPYIKRIEVAHELTGAGPGGTHGVLVYRDDAYGIVNEIPQGVAALPVQTTGFDSMVPMYMSHGGIVMRDVGNNALAWVEV